VLINATADVCGFLNGTNKDLLSGWILATVRDALPQGFLHPCPWVFHAYKFVTKMFFIVFFLQQQFGTLAFNNIYIKSYKDEMFPDGLYLMKLHFFNNRDDNIFLFKNVMEARRTGLGSSRF